MKITLRIAMIAATVVLLSATSVFAQAPNMRVHIPFAFSAGETRLPAGDYRILRDPTFYVFRMEPEDGRAIYLPIPRTFVHSKQASGSLYFHKYGDQYFLHKIDAGGDALQYEWRESRAEREMAKIGVPVEFAFVRAASH